MSTLGQRVRQTRKSQDLIQKDLARRADISTPFVSDIENDKRNVSSEVLMRLSDALGVTMHWLMTGQELNGELKVADRHVEIPRPLEAAAAKGEWTFSEALDLLKAVEHVHHYGSGKTRAPTELSTDDWQQIYLVFEQIQS